MCLFSSPAAIQPAPVAPVTPDVKPMVSPEDSAKGTTGANRAQTRRSLRIDLPGSDGSGLNVPQ